MSCSLEVESTNCELSKNAMGLDALMIWRLLIKKFDLNKALSRYLSFAGELKLQLTLMIYKPSMLNEVDVNSNKF